MLVDTPQIVWHGGEAGKNAPVLSVDSHPSLLIATDGGSRPGQGGKTFVLATAGTDTEVRLWLVNCPASKDESSWEQTDACGRLQSFLTSLGGHQRGVNVVRFSPDGLSLASASDGGTVIVWTVEAAGAWGSLKSDREARTTVLRGATEDVYDLTWSPDSKYIACGSIDRRSHLWEVATKRSVATLEDHANYVQVRRSHNTAMILSPIAHVIPGKSSMCLHTAVYGEGTAWDPLSRYLATQSSDRTCRLYHLAHKSHEGGNGAPGLGHLVVKSCNVIKSCFVPSDGGSTSAGASEDTGGAVDVSTTQTAEKADGSSSGMIVAETTAVGVATPSKTAPIKGDQLDDNTEMGGAQSFIRASVRENGHRAQDTTAVKLNCTKEEVSPACGLDSVKDKTKHAQRKNLFVDETVASFFRRLSWSPDGALLITPTAQDWDSTTKKTQFCTYLFTRGQYVRPAACLPGLNKPSVAVRCNPRLFSLRGDRQGADANGRGAPLCDLPYRVIFAVASLDAIVVYDTEHSLPLTVATGLHYSGLTDVCWSSDGHSIFISSTDGYVSRVHFAPGELGFPIPESEVPLHMKRLRSSGKEGCDEVASGVPMAPPSSPSPGQAGEQHDRLSPTSRTDDITEHRQTEGAPPLMRSSDAVLPRPKKKIVPTLVTPLLSPSESGDVQPGQTLHANAADVDVSNLSQAAKATPRDDVSEKVKRRIAPTFVCSRGDVAGPDSPTESANVFSPEESRLAKLPTKERKRHQPGAGGSVASSTGEVQADRAAKKKRLAPTLVSAL